MQSRALLLGWAALLPLVIVCRMPYGADEPTVMRVAENWEVVLNEPDQDAAAPRFHTAISRNGELGSFRLMAGRFGFCAATREDWLVR